MSSLILRGKLAREIHPLRSSCTLISTGETGDTKVKMIESQCPPDHILAVHIVTTRPTESFDSFLLQARGAEQSDGNASLVGSFTSPLPSISKPLSCQDLPSSSLTDKGRPVLLQNLTFTWLSPSSDHGDIRFTASLAKGKSALATLHCYLPSLSQTGSISSLRAVRSPSTPSPSPYEAVAGPSRVSVSATTRPAPPALRTSPTISPSSHTALRRSSSPSAWAARSWASPRSPRSPRSP